MNDWNPLLVPYGQVGGLVRLLSKGQARRVSEIENYSHRRVGAHTTDARVAGEPTSTLSVAVAQERGLGLVFHHPWSEGGREFPLINLQLRID